MSKTRLSAQQVYARKDVGLPDWKQCCSQRYATQVLPWSYRSAVVF